MSEYSQHELDEMAVEFAEMDAEFEGLGFEEMDAEVSEAMSELDAELGGSGLEAMDFSTASIGELVDNDVDAQFINRFLKSKAAKIIRKIVALVRRYSKCAKCLPKVLKAVRLFKAKKYGSAIKAAFDAYRCIRACTR